MKRSFSKLIGSDPLPKEKPTKVIQEEKLPIKLELFIMHKVITIIIKEK